ncbi:MAG: ABC transporter permease [Micavibrio aeruginosavorus]|nr:ABC transporter permease [Micavibrio aeruginosavorus]
MAESANAFQELKPRRIGRMNVIGLATLIRKEVGRFANVYIQTIVAPMITTLLFYTVFAVAFGSAERMIGDLPYLEFLVPGLIMMSMAQNAFANTSSSLMISKVQGNIVDLLMPPLSPFEIVLGYVAAGVIRGLVVGLACLAVVFFFAPVKIFSIIVVLAYAILGTLMLSTLGIAAGLWSEKFDHLSAITNFLVMPLTFLSGTFYSIHSLSPTWQAVAQMNITSAC